MGIPAETHKSIVIDKEFKNLIPPLTVEEYAHLEESILKEGCRDALVLWNGILIDGHSRYEICKKHAIEFDTVDIEFKDRHKVIEWIILNQFGRRNLSAYDRSLLALRLKPIIAEKAKEQQLSTLKQNTVSQISVERKPIDTQKELAKVAGVSHDTIHKVEKIEANAIPEVKEKVISGSISINTASEITSRPQEEQREIIVKSEKDIIAEANKIKRERKVKRKKEKEQARQEAFQKVIKQPVSDRYKLIVGDIAEACQQIENDSIDVIITDPPYPKEYLQLYGILAKEASRVLKPGGSLIVMTGQSYLPEILSLMTPHIRYHWTVSYLTPGGQSAQIWHRKVNTFWKPLLWFVKGEYNGGWIGDVTKSAVNDNDKRFHNWGQSESGMVDIVERFSMPGQTILDPFLGGGTTAVVAVKLGRYFIGIDQDPAAIQTTALRLAEIT